MLEIKFPGSNRQERSKTKYSAIMDFVTRYDRILQEGFAEEERTQPLQPRVTKRGKLKKSKSKNLLDRMKEHKLSVLSFLLNVPKRKRGNHLLPNTWVSLNSKEERILGL
jgi:hypothetical protein